MTKFSNILNQTFTEKKNICGALMYRIRYFSDIHPNFGRVLTLNKSPRLPPVCASMKLSLLPRLSPCGCRLYMAALCKLPHCEYIMGRNPSQLGQNHCFLALKAFPIRLLYFTRKEMFTLKKQKLDKLRNY